MQERPIELPQTIEQEINTDTEPIVEVLGKIQELNVAKQTNIDRTRYIPID